MKRLNEFGIICHDVYDYYGVLVVVVFNIIQCFFKGVGQMHVNFIFNWGLI